MHIIPILPKGSDQTSEAISLFQMLGCKIYQDRGGQLYATANSIGCLFRDSPMVFETDNLPPHWVLIQDGLAA